MFYTHIHAPRIAEPNTVDSSPPALPTSPYHFYHNPSTTRATINLASASSTGGEGGEAETFVYNPPTPGGMGRLGQWQ